MVSEKAFKEVPSKECVSCSTPLAELLSDDLYLPVNPTVHDEIDGLWRHFQAKKLRLKELKVGIIIQWS
jgi:hypothetical protein